jgi:hypothetical protein
METMMAEVQEPQVRHADGKIVVDAEFLREQAKEAVETFFAPLAGVYAAAKGERIFFRRRHRRGKKAA